MMSGQNWQCKEGDPFAPNCGACPGDGSVCPSTCKVAEESPPVAQDIKALLRLMADRTHTAGPKTLAAHLTGAANHIEQLERQLAETSNGNAMYEHVRTLNPHQFDQLCADNIAGKGKFDDLVLADMDKRMKDKSQ